MSTQIFLSWLTMDTSNPYGLYIFNPFNLMGEFTIYSKATYHMQDTKRQLHPPMHFLVDTGKGTVFAFCTPKFPSLFLFLSSQRVLFFCSGGLPPEQPFLFLRLLAGGAYSQRKGRACLGLVFSCIYDMGMKSSPCKRD